LLIPLLYWDIVSSLIWNFLKIVVTIPHEVDFLYSGQKGIMIIAFDWGQKAIRRR
jgi:hypothetical protein